MDGLLNVYGIPKPSYRAFQLLHWTGHKVLQTTPDTLYSANETLGVFAIAGNSNISVFAVNWNVKGQPITAQTAHVSISDLPPGKPQAVVYRIDAENSNAYLTWIKMGMPKYLSQDQVQQLKAASELSPQPISLDTSTPKELSFSVNVPENAVINVVVSFV